MPQTHFAVIALGSNLAEPDRQVRAALSTLEAHSQIQIEKTSSLYVTAPVGYDEQQLFADLKQKILPQYPAPDLVIYLQTAVDGNRKRLQKRGDGIINLFPEGYLGRIHEGYSQFFHLYQNSPLLTVNADELDLQGNDEHFQLLLNALNDLQGTRNYLNLSER